MYSDLFMDVRIGPPSEMILREEAKPLPWIPTCYLEKLQPSKSLLGGVISSGGNCLEKA